MFRTIRYLAISALVAGALAAQAQTPTQQAASGNPMARGERHSFSFSVLSHPSTAPIHEAIERPVSRFGPVTPVPEPSEWAMLLVGLTFVGWIVRRKTKQ